MILFSRLADFSTTYRHLQEEANHVFLMLADLDDSENWNWLNWRAKPCHFYFLFSCRLVFVRKKRPLTKLILVNKSNTALKKERTRRKRECSQVFVKEWMNQKHLQWHFPLLVLSKLTLNNSQNIFRLFQGVFIINSIIIYHYPKRWTSVKRSLNIVKIFLKGLISVVDVFAAGRKGTYYKYRHVEY